MLMAELRVSLEFQIIWGRWQDVPTGVTMGCYSVPGAHIRYNSYYGSLVIGSEILQEAF